MEKNVVCSVCNMEFPDQAEHDAHHELAHKKYPVKEDSDLQDGDDPVAT